MARTPGTTKAETHERILRSAGKAIRKKGFASTSVGDVMRDAGLTHGGFYAHFDSREAMLAEALDLAAGDSMTSLLGKATVAAAQQHVHPLEALVKLYLSDAAVAATDAGCTIASLGGETRRQNPEIRHAATRRITELAAAIGQVGSTRPGSPDPYATLSALVGALVIARIVDEPELSQRIRDAAARLALGDAPAGADATSKPT